MSNKTGKAFQCERILMYMRRFGSITPLEALADLGVMRLASRISDLRKRGVAIRGEMITVENRFGEKIRVKRYSLAA